jgi:hypothetical protein
LRNTKADPKKKFSLGVTNFLTVVDGMLLVPQ